MSPLTPDILLVEDSRTAAELFVLALEANKSDLVLHVVRDGAEALALLLGGVHVSGLAEAPLPRLLLLDLHMPGLNGFEVLERLRAHERTRLLPVVVFSASDAEAHKDRAMRCGATAYLDKPIGFRAACDVIADLERKWLSSEPPAPKPHDESDGDPPCA